MVVSRANTGAEISENSASMSKSDEDWSEDQDSSQEEALMSVNPPLNDPNGMGQQATNAMDMDVMSEYRHLTCTRLF